MLSLTSLQQSCEAAFRLRGFVNNQFSPAASKQIERRPSNMQPLIVAVKDTTMANPGQMGQEEGKC